MYKEFEIWEATIGETLSCKKNVADVMQSLESVKILSHEKFPLYSI